MITLERPKATLDDLYRLNVKAEIINGEIVEFMATGRVPTYAAFQVAVALQVHVRAKRSRPPPTQKFWRLPIRKTGFY